MRLQREDRPTGDTSAWHTVWWYLCRWSSVEASGREEWKRSGGRAGSLGERCLPSPGVLSLRKQVVVDYLAQQVIGGSLQEQRSVTIELRKCLLFGYVERCLPFLLSQDTDAVVVAVSQFLCNLTRAQKSLGLLGNVFAVCKVWRHFARGTR